MNRIIVTQQGHAFTANIGNSYSHGFIDNDNNLFITDIEVSESMRGKGLGTKLVNAIIRKSNAKNVKAVHIIPKAVPFWKALKIKEGEPEFNKHKQLINERESYIKQYVNKQFSRL
jgi:predicted GNAT family acetyltransferase